MKKYRFLDSGVLYYPARDLLFYHADIKGNYLMKQRMEVIRSMVTRQKNQEITVITTMECFSGRAFSGRGNRFEADSDLIRRYC